MQAKQPIADLLTELQTLYDATADPMHKSYYAKFALLEMCGWLELVFDDLALAYGTSRLVELDNINFLRNDIVGRTYGFSYAQHFRAILMRLIGINSLENLEDILRSIGALPVLVSQLNTLWNLRKPAAHTTILGTVTTYSSPSVITGYLNTLYPVLVTLETELNKI